VRSDLELLDGWRAGDNAAGEELVGRHWASISRFFRSKIGDDGADLISQTFLACVEARDRIEGDNVKAYLFAVARRRLANHFRQRARTPELDFAVSSPRSLRGYLGIWRLLRQTLNERRAIRQGMRTSRREMRRWLDIRGVKTP